MKRLRVVMTVLTSAAILLAACGAPAATPTAAPPTTAPTREPTVAPPEAGPVTVSLWFHSGRGGERDALTQILDNFARDHPEIQVDAVELPEGDYNQQVQAGAVANDLPCLLDFDGPNLYNYVWGGFLVPLDPYVSAEMRADFLPSIIDQGTYNGQLYSLGQFDSGLAIWAHRSALEMVGARIPTVEEPWTRDEFNQLLADLKATGEYEYPLDMKMNYVTAPPSEWLTYGFSPILQSFGADLIDRTTYRTAEGVLNGPEAVEALTMIQDWFRNGYVNARPAGDTDFTDGTAALSWVGHWVATDYIQRVGDDLLLLPMPDFGQGPRTGMGSWNWGITANCTSPDAAWTVLDYLLTPEAIGIMTAANGAVPARMSAVASDPRYAEGGILNLYIQQINAGFTVPRPITAAYPTITTAFSTAFFNIVVGMADVQDELDAAVDRIDADLQANNYYPSQ